MNKAFYLCILVLMLCVGAVRAEAPWSATASGCEVLDSSFRDADRRVSFVLVRCDPKRVDVRLVDTSSELGKGNPYAAFSLREVMDKVRASIVVNAGSTASYSVPIPAGLLEVRGVIVQPPKFYVKNAAALCINRDRVSIVKISSRAPKGCEDAVQRGPFLSKELSEVDNSGRYRRTVAAVDGQGRLLILVTRDGATLSSVASFLYGTEHNLGVSSALNLDGDASSGLIFASSEGIKDSVVGSVDGLVASAIAIGKRR